MTTWEYLWTSHPGDIEVLMIDDIKMNLADVPPELKARKAATPAVNHLFDERDDESNKVEETGPRHIMGLLYLSQRARPDLRLAVSSLGRRVTKCNDDDSRKFGRVIRDLEESIDLPLRLHSGNLNCLMPPLAYIQTWKDTP
jgi:hypothetical protein